FAVSYYFYSPSFIEFSSITLLLGTALLAIIFFSTNKERVPNLQRQYLRHSTLVIFGFVVVHFQYHIDYLLGYVNEFNPYIWVNNQIVVKALSVSVAGLISFLIGYLLNRGKIKSVYRKKENNRVVSVNLLSYFAAVLLMAYFYFANPLYLIGFYGAEGLGAEASYIILLFKTVVFAALIQTARNLKLREFRCSNFLSYINE